MTDIDQFRQDVRAWLEAHCPLSMRQPIVPEEIIWSSSNIEFQTADQRLWFERMRDRGWFAPGWPEDYGGGGLDTRQVRVLEQEMTRLGCRQPQYNLGVWMLGPVLLEYGSHEQKLEHLVPMMQGRSRWCQGFSEPNAGSDLASLKTSASVDGDELVINGAKMWTSYGDKADWMYALVRTNAQAPSKQAGISFVLIDMHAPGVTVKPIELISGKSAFCQVFFDDVRVPLRNMVGKMNEGWEVAKRLLQHEREAMSTFSEGAAPSHDLLAAAQTMLADGEGYIADRVLRDRLAGVLMDSHAFTLTHRRIKEESMARRDVSGPAAIMKLVMTEQDVAKYELLVQSMGQRALGWEGDEFNEDELSICRSWLLSKTLPIAGGTSEIQLNIIARRILGLPA